MSTGVLIMTVEQLRNDFIGLLAQLKPYGEKSKAGTLTADENATFDALIERANNAREALNAAEDREAKSSELLKLERDYNAPAHVGRDVAHPESVSSEGGQTVRTVTIGQKFVNSPEFKDSKNRTSRGGMRNGMKLPSFYEAHLRNADPEAVKAVLGSANAGANFVQPQVLPNVYRGLEPALTVRDVFLNMRTNSDAIIVPQEQTFTNAAAAVAEATAVNNGGKPESTLALTETTFPVRTIAHYLPITRQMIEDSALIETYVDTRLRQGLAREEEDQFINGDGNAPNLTGILATSGTQTLDESYFTSNPVQDAGAGNENLNRIRRAKRVVAVTGEAQATFVILNPADAEVLDTVSDVNGQYLLGGPLAGEQRRIWGLPVVESSSLAAGTAIVGDGTMAAVVDRMDAAVLISDSHDDWFVRNLLAVLAEERVAFPIFRPAAFAEVTLISA